MRLKRIINTECLQYLPELTQQPDKKKKQTKKQNMVMKTYKELLGIGTCTKSKKQHT